MGSAAEEGGAVVGTAGSGDDELERSLDFPDLRGAGGGGASTSGAAQGGGDGDELRRGDTTGPEVERR